MMCERALSRETAGRPAGRQAVRAGLHRRLVRPAHAVPAVRALHRVGDRQAQRLPQGPQGHRRGEGASCPTVLHDIAWRAMQVHGALGVSNEMPFHGMMLGASVMGLADGPTEVHKVTVARQVLRDYQAERRPLADRAPARSSWPRPARSSPSTSSTRWGTCDRHRPPRQPGWTSQGLARQGRAARARASSPAARQNEIYEIRRGDLHGALRIPPPDRARAAATTASSASGASSRRSTAPTCPTPPAIAVCDRPVGARPDLLPDGLRRRLVADGPTDGWPAPFDTDLEARAGPRLPARRGHRPAVEGRLAGQGPRRTSAGPTASTSARSTAGPRSSSASRAASCPASTRPSAWLRAHRPIDYIPGLMHGDYQFANVMYRARRAGPARRHRRLGDGHRRRPEARPRLGGAELARGHDGAGSGASRATST